MKIQKLTLSKIRSFDHACFDFSSRINLFVGPNNSGKSSVIAALRLLQTESGTAAVDSRAMIRNNESEGSVAYQFDEVEEFFHQRFPFMTAGKELSELRLTFREGSVQAERLINGAPYARATGFGQVLTGEEGNNLFHFFLSRRKANGFNHSVNRATQRTIREDFHHLPARIDRLTSGQNSSSRRFGEYQERVLGFRLGTNGTPSGKMPGEFVGDKERFIELTNMGEGVANIAALLVELALAKDKIFLIEELENDLHPTAIIRLLEIITECSESNQFILTTHSHIVVTRLAGLPDTHTYSFTLDRPDGIPTTTVQKLRSSASDRQQLLADLGYTTSDLGHWDGYLVLEESTAQSVIENVLVPFFVPSLVGRLKCVSSSGVTEVERSFESLNKLYLFLHLTPVFDTKSWVRVDNDPAGQKAIERLRSKYSTKAETKFRVFSQPQFERYYPAEFSERVNQVLAMPAGKERQAAKGQLCRDVVQWAIANQEEAKPKFETSAAEIVAELRSFATQLG